MAISTERKGEPYALPFNAIGKGGAEVVTMLTPKQETFAQAVASGKTQADAYRAAYDAGKMKPETVIKRASELMQDGDITGRVQELRKPIAEKAQVTLESHLADLKMLRNLAVEEKQISAAISAEVARGKAAGVHIEKADIRLTTVPFTIDDFF